MSLQEAPQEPTSLQTASRTNVSSNCLRNQRFCKVPQKPTSLRGATKTPLLKRPRNNLSAGRHKSQRLCKVPQEPTSPQSAARTPLDGVTRTNVFARDREPTSLQGAARTSASPKCRKKSLQSATRSCEKCSHWGPRRRAQRHPGPLTSPGTGRSA